MTVGAWIIMHEKEHVYDKRIKDLEAQFGAVRPALKEAIEALRGLDRLAKRIPDIEKALDKIESFDKTY
jgi:hypothetical protein